MGAQKFIPIVFFIYFLLLLFDAYFVYRFTKYLKSRNVNKKIITSIWILSVLIFIISLLAYYLRLNREAAGFTTQIIILISAFWYLPKIIITPIIILKDIFLFLRKLLRRKKSSYSEINTEKTLTTRRKIIQNTGWALAGLPFLAVFDGFIRTTNNFKVFNIDITLPKLASRLNGLRIVQISDIHAGSILTQKPIVDLAFIVESLKADIIFVTGDFVNFTPDEMSILIPFLENIRARHGVYGCLGNHDHYMTPEQHSQLIKIIRDCGINLLINENITIDIDGEKLQIASVDNSSYDTKFGDMNKTLRGLQDYLPTILLCHDPGEWDKKIRKKTHVDLTLSGHTHGGQMGINVFGNIYTPARYVYKEYAGLYSDNNQHLYVNRGIGTIGPPLRLAIPPEVTLITLYSTEKFA